MSSASRTRSDRGSALVLVLLAIPATLLVFYLLTSVMAAQKSWRVQRGWEQTLGTVDQLLQRYPSVEANASALQLEALSAGLGIDIAPRWDDERIRPEPEVVAEHRALKRAVADYLQAQLERPRRGPEPPPEELATWLDRHAGELDAVHRHLTSAEPPSWERQLELGMGAPIANLLGHIDLQKLLVTDALARLGAGDRDGALADLDASWRLNAALRDEPVLIVQLVSIAITRLQAGALRQIDNVPVAWSDRLVGHDFRASFLQAMRFEGWAWTQIDDASALGKSGFLSGALFTIGQPYVTYCTSDMSEAFRRRLELLAELPVLCDGDLAAVGADLDIPVPRWNLIGDTVVPNLASAVDRVARLELDIELTRKLIEIDSAADGEWPGSWPGIDRSRACPEDRWLYRVADDGSMSIAFHRDIGWPDQLGVILPTSFEAPAR